MALPLPKVVADVERGGPFVTAARGLNALKKEKSDAQYAPYTNYANALSKIAYAKYAPANAIAQMMSGPGAAQMTKEQATALASQFQNMVKNSGDYSNNLPVPNGGGNIFGGSLAGNIGGMAMKGLKSIWDKVMPGAQVDANDSGNPMNMPQTRNDFTPMDQLPEGSNNQPPSMPQPPKSSGSRFQNLAQSLRMPGAQGGENANSGAEAEKTRLVTGAGAEASSQVKQQAEMEEKDIAASNASVEMTNQIKKLRESRKRLYGFEKGNVLGIPLGSGPAMTSAAQESDNAKQNIANTIASMAQSGHINVADRDIANTMKAGREVNDQAFENLTNYAEGAAHRVNEKPAFNRAMAQAGLTPSETQILWANYNLNKPFYDSNSHQIDDHNLGSWEKFYGNTKNIEAAFSPQAQKKINVSQKSSEKNMSGISAAKKNQKTPKGKTHIRNKKTGETGYIPKDRLEAYQANGYEEI